MKTEQTQVKEWMAKFGQETPDKPCIPSLEVRKLRAKLILEEALETIEGLGFVLSDAYDSAKYVIDNTREGQLLFAADITLIADGIADSLVVQLGTAVACGIDIKPIFDEVMRSNWSKLWTTTEVCNQLGVDWLEHISYIDPTNLYVFTLIPELASVKRRWLCKDNVGKVIKSPSYLPANISLDV